MIESVEINEVEKSLLESELRECNKIVSFYHEKYKQAEGLKKHKKFKFFKMLSELAPGQEGTVGQISVSPEHTTKIARIKEIEWRLLQGFSKMISNIAARWHRNLGNSPLLGLEDLESEAISAVVYSTVYFGDQAKYSTFIHHCIHRRLSRVCAQISGVPRGAMKKKKQYQALRLEEGSTLDSVVQKMGLSDREVQNLVLSLGKTKSVCEDSCGFVADERLEETKELPFFKEIVESLDLTDIERAVLEGFMNSSTSRLGIGSVAKKLINPKTNKPYTRMSFSYAWERVKKKIKDACTPLASEKAA